MATLEIFGIPQSTYTRTVRMACEEKGVPYELKVARPHSPEVNAIHPFGKVPVLRHDGLELCESKAIASYLDRAFGGPKLIPDDAKAAAQVEQWVSLINTAIDPAMIREYVLGYVFAKDGKPDRARIDGAVEKMNAQAAALDKALANTGHLVGHSITLADLFLLPILFYVGQFPEGAELMKSHPNLSAYYDRHAARPSFKNTAPPPPPK